MATVAWNLTGAPAGNVRITDMDLYDIDNRRLTNLSTDDHRFFDGNTRIHGTITVTGPSNDILESVVLEVVGPGGVTAKARLSAGARQALLQRFGSDRTISITRPQLMFLLPSAQATLLDSDENGAVELRAIARTRQGRQSNPTTGTPISVPRLVRYTGTNRYLCCNAAEGGDTWALPTVRTAAAAVDDVVAGTVWGDFSNMNGGHFPPHETHQEGVDVDGHFTGYNARDAAVAQDMLDILRHRTHGTSIRTIVVTYNRRPNDPTELCEPRNGQRQRDGDHSAFFRAIQGVRVPAPGGGTRLATNVIVSEASHCRHFHIRFFPN